MRRFLFLTLGLFLIVIVGYNVLSHGISYSIQGYRNYDGKLNKKTMSKFETEIDYYDVVNSADISDYSLSKTTSTLSFRMKHDATRNPNTILKKGAGHCVMYSYLFASTFNQVCAYKGVRATARVAYGQVYFYGMNLTKIIPSSFFKNHDFNVIKDKKSIHIVDTLLFDYFWIADVKLHA